MLLAGAAIAIALCTIVFALLRLDARINIAAALGLLLTTVVTLALGKGALANMLVIYAYFLLASGVVLLVVEYIRGEPHRDRPEKTQKPGAGSRGK